MGVQIVGRDDHAIRDVGVPVSESTWIGERTPSPRDTVTIGADVWVGGGSTILSGVTIGAGAIIAAGSVVVNDVDEFAIVAGNPARAVSVRFDSVEARQAHLHSLEQRVASLPPAQKRASSASAWRGPRRRTTVSDSNLDRKD
ncbi:DapH/DapD/GlmU-related protein [Demequina sp. SYSU T00068]|nr:DapH/DapD/GlmU-related protein [Demequina sp. SYSU T00068]MDN4490651.1 DapH/DapD/GlmU-related protein [Demequina sp. SYSU T00068]